LKPKTPPAPLKNAPPHADANAALEKLAEMPEFTTIAAQKKNINEVNKLCRIV